MPLYLMQVVQPRYAEAIRLATQALERSQNREASSRPLPFMFGSPEYLQVIPSAFCCIKAQGQTCKQYFCRVYACFCTQLSADAWQQSAWPHACTAALQVSFQASIVLMLVHAGSTRWAWALIPGWRPPPPVAASASGLAPEWAEYSSAAASTVGEFDADEFSMAEGASDASGMQRLPDFKSMLEAALRGDVVRGLAFC